MGKLFGKYINYRIRVALLYQFFTDEQSRAGLTMTETMPAFKKHLTFEPLFLKK